MTMTQAEPAVNDLPRIHRLPLFDVAWKGQPLRRLTWVEVMEKGADGWGQWRVPENTLALAQTQLLAGLLGWAVRRTGLSWDTLARELSQGGEPWSQRVAEMAALLDEEATSLTDPRAAVLQLPSGWVTVDTDIEGVLSPFTITPGANAKAFHVRRERLTQLCAGCALQALVRLHSASAQRAQYWSETPLGRGAIAWTAHLQDEAEQEHVVWTALLNIDLETSDDLARAAIRPGWATDPATGEPWVASLVHQHAQGQAVDLGFPLLPMTRGARLGDFSAASACCDLCQAQGPVVRRFGLLPEPATSDRFWADQPAAQPRPKAAKLFMRLTPEGRRHPWTVLISRPAKEEGQPDLVFPQSIQAQLGVRSVPTWSHLTSLLPHMVTVGREVATNAPSSLRRLPLARLMLQERGPKVRQVIKAFATKPEKTNPNLAAFLATSFDVSRLEGPGERTDVDRYLRLLQAMETAVTAYREAWISLGAEVSLASRRVGTSKDERFRNRPLLQISTLGVKAMERDQRTARAQALVDPLLLATVHQAWGQATLGLSEYLSQQASEEKVIADLFGQMDRLAWQLRRAWQLRTGEVRDWARVHHAYRLYQKALIKSVGPLRPSIDVDQEGLSHEAV